MKLIERYEAVKKIGTEIEVPWVVWTAFGEKAKLITITGTDICLGEDYKTLEQARAAIAWYVDQLGGSAKWSKS